MSQSDYLDHDVKIVISLNEKPISSQRVMLRQFHVKSQTYTSSPFSTYLLPFKPKRLTNPQQNLLIP